MVAYSGCQKNVPIEGRFSVTTPYAAVHFPEHHYDKRYKRPRGLLERILNCKPDDQEAKIATI